MKIIGLMSGTSLDGCDVALAEINDDKYELIDYLLYPYTIDFKNRIFPVFFDGENTHILNYEDKEIELSTFINKVPNIRFNFYSEDATKIKEIVNKYNKMFL